MKRVALSEIQIDSGTQARVCINQETVERYAERMTEGDVFPPVVLFHDGSHYHIGDGYHRVLAAESQKFMDIDADVRKGTAKDALWFALGANKENGQPMTRRDIRNAVEIALRTWPEKTQMQIAEQVGCSQRYVGMVADAIRSSSNGSLPETRVNARGEERPTTYKRKETEPTETEQQETKTKQEQEQETTRKETMQSSAKISIALEYARVAILNLEKIPSNDADRKKAIETVKEWINENE